MDTRQTDRPRRAARRPQPGEETKRPATKRPRRTTATPRRAPLGRSQSQPTAPQNTPAPVPRPRKPDIEREVIYTPGKPFNRNRLLLQICVVVAVVIAVFLSMSLFFKVETITVSGNSTYGIQAVVNASGILKGDSLLAINDAKVSGHIITELPYVKTVRIGIKLPGTVNIEIEELDVVYSIADDAGQWWLLTSEGRLVEMTDNVGAADRTKLLGVTITDAAPGRQATAQEAPAATTSADATAPLTPPVTISGSQKLMVALSVLRSLERNNVIGKMTSLDVSDMGNIILMYGDQFRIVLGDSSELAYKIDLAVAAIGQLKEHDRGSLDISFVDRPEVVYTPQKD